MPKKQRSHSWRAASASVASHSLRLSAPRTPPGANMYHWRSRSASCLFIRGGLRAICGFYVIHDSSRQDGTSTRPQISPLDHIPRFFTAARPPR
ncbi:hypothetical protein EJ02DRAFT_76862 [Clathrospora elynae]|uniref:Uncharacterized protein n=1 Tax=Clathrospora elynae TaxID=706981 RepID=A0A6A5T6M3_9PLEO|nr:hypothetical protein EJ02DRAFT_76862 [Clathrospora elynae]